MIYMSRENEVLDQICYRHYRTIASASTSASATGQTFNERDTTAFILSINPHLVNYPAILPEGVAIELPDLAINNAAEPTNYLWS